MANAGADHSTPDVHWEWGHLPEEEISGPVVSTPTFSTSASSDSVVGAARDVQTNASAEARSAAAQDAARATYNLITASNTHGHDVESITGTTCGPHQAAVATVADRTTASTTGDVGNQPVRLYTVRRGFFSRIVDYVR